ncbi:KUP/HAK/KT family potassium transporter [Parasporobacterium paucivorans]|uniref:Probable potassium transport system protein Kup n=1 Tax=Parasporobacterium paucivorans DSM 15970 TaxID=1122934 RepID=A0A1M6IUW6_9FIRM|nr:KUP/HAK/KT family potassium transporter [Parasporobacterium paucivorans]SHJ38237.1 KUP system potassium uptake protein [Parasporobacterium paucivorans DSM 15970]
MKSLMDDNSKKIPLSAGYMLIALGIVYGDIGTSPLYVMKSIVSGNGGLAMLDNDFIIGALSLVIWTITLITTVKYVVFALKADNHGEGGIFSLYHLVLKRGKLLVIPAMIGGAALLADGVLTPAVTVTSAIEGLRGVPFIVNIIGNGQGAIIGISIVIISAIFAFQRAGTSLIGKAFGPIMVLWFTFLAITGILMIRLDPHILLAFNPLRGAELLFSPNNKAGFMILGSIFLATTGAEALYSDMGHVGKLNIYGSWPYVKVCLILNYLGQGAWLMHARLHPKAYSLSDLNPFFDMLPDRLRLFSVILSTMAAIIASQALITGAYTLVKEAIHLGLLPHLQIQYPAEKKGQMFIPMVNHLLWGCCICVILFFQSSGRMEAAYGLAITVTMLMTTILLFQYLHIKKVPTVFTIIFLVFFGALEVTFFLSNAVKFVHGGYVAVMLAFLILIVMLTWYVGHRTEKKHEILFPAAQFVEKLCRLREDDSIPYSAINLVYMTINGDMNYLERDVLYSILDKRPKRAQVYWFIHINVVEDPYTMAYSVQDFGTNFCFKVKLKLGFKVEQRINVFMRQIIQDLMKSGELKPQLQIYSLYEGSNVGDFEFVFIKKTLAPDSDVSGFERVAMRLKYAINSFTGSPVRWFGLENANTIIESVPLLVKQEKTLVLKRELQ